MSIYIYIYKNNSWSIVSAMCDLIKILILQIQNEVNIYIYSNKGFFFFFFFFKYLIYFFLNHNFIDDTGLTDIFGADTRTI
jgi:hypothetical protein